MKKYKKIIICVVVAVALVCTIIPLTNQSKFCKVQSVTYKIDGSWITRQSEFCVEIEKYSEIVSYNEYKSAENKYKTTDLNSVLNYTINVDGTYYDPQYEIGKYIYFIDVTIYKKIKITGFSINYIYVDEIDSDTIKIKVNKNGYETTYNVEAYKIIHFK